MRSLFRSSTEGVHPVALVRGATSASEFRMFHRDSFPAAHIQRVARTVSMEQHNSS